MSCEIYAMNIRQAIPKTSLQDLLQFVTDERKQKLTRFMYQEDILRSLLGELIIRCLAVKLLQIKNSELQFARGEFGKPYLKHHPCFHFNISHSGDWAVGAISKHAVGIDIERMNRNKIDLELAERYFTDTEKAYIFAGTNLYDRHNRFLTIWTLKESYIKCTGEGLKIPLDSFAILHTDSGYLVEDSSRKSDVYLFNSGEIGGYSLSLTAAEPLTSPNITVLDVDHVIDTLMHSR